jgi:hypothetical protein
MALPPIKVKSIINVTQSLEITGKDNPMVSIAKTKALAGKSA